MLITALKKTRRNFSLVSRYSLKFSPCSLLVVKSLLTRCKIHSLLIAEVARCKKSLITRCKIHSLLVAKKHSLLLAKFAHYLLQKLLVAKNYSLLLAKNHSLLITFCNFTKKQLQHRCFPVNFCETWKTPILWNICKRLLLKLISNVNKLFTGFYVNQVFHLSLIELLLNCLIKLN